MDKLKNKKVVSEIENFFCASKNKHWRRSIYYTFLIDKREMKFNIKSLTHWEDNSKVRKIENQEPTKKEREKA